MNQKNNLVKNASFLMIAAMISKVIGLLYKSPLSNIIGSLGMGYTSLAQNAYMILLMIASFSIPQAVSKLISERIALKDYRNAHKFFKGAMIYAMVIGGVVGLFCLFGAGLIIPQNQKDAIPALQILAPTIFLSGILGVFRGYFQAYRNMMPTSISQIIEQVFNAAVSLLAAWGFINAFSDGTENSIAKLNKVIQDAEAVFHDENAKQDQVNAQISALEEAMEALVLLIDEAKENLAALIAQAEAAVQQSEIYTEESLQALQSALDAAKMIYENPSASVDDVKGQCIALQKALDSLVEW